MAQREKESFVKITQMTPMNNELYGLGDNGKVYWWSQLNNSWMEYKV